ncbi:hypothetical protein L596_029017 [Steinernema carpocapsae]|uniref:RING-CH-type domain-containing protein n=1 Tax=Steinernema carpocapsae TaxID=34508 RepID=A0A4U5LTD7_STECR|nr:hypothetical protein L596_029017 [Steinernema carpocapsae]
MSETSESSLSSYSSSRDRCRICKSSSGVLCSPCRCKGSHKSVHEKCLKMWFDTRVGKSRICEICHFECEFKEEETGSGLVTWRVFGNAVLLYSYALFCGSIAVTPLILFSCYLICFSSPKRYLTLVEIALYIGGTLLWTPRVMHIFKTELELPDIEDLVKDTRKIGALKRGDVALKSRLVLCKHFAFSIFFASLGAGIEILVIFGLRWDCLRPVSSTIYYMFAVSHSLWLIMLAAVGTSVFCFFLDNYRPVVSLLAQPFSQFVVHLLLGFLVLLTIPGAPPDGSLFEVVQTFTWPRLEDLIKYLIIGFSIHHFLLHQLIFDRQNDAASKSLKWFLGVLLRPPATLPSMLLIWIPGVVSRLFIFILLVAGPIRIVQLILPEGFPITIELPMTPAINISNIVDFESAVNESSGTLHQTISYLRVAVGWILVFKCGTFRLSVDYAGALVGRTKLMFPILNELPFFILMVVVEILTCLFFAIIHMCILVGFLEYVSPWLGSDNLEHANFVPLLIISLMLKLIHCSLTDVLSFLYISLKTVILCLPIGVLFYSVILYACKQNALSYLQTPEDYNQLFYSMVFLLLMSAQEMFLAAGANFAMIEEVIKDIAWILLYAFVWIAPITIVLSFESRSPA